MLSRLCVALPFLSFLVLQPAHAGIFGATPDAIVCTFKAVAGRPGGQAVFHVDMKFESGSILYRPLGVTAAQVTLNTDGKIEATNIADCDGKTVQELRDVGRAFDYR